ncbi:YqiJ family protein [Thalassococcus sp. CAU 1522]|uniref:YqiJ family protein n=1 Tax=Thalassococcus arenae TaxID=2851652 RepID=A0ABS6N6X2_9RHOB|nr:OB-fold-containig protein [Thalassococcus arenae]MBV2359265.1 YqiJ family protein [Thalassococcus arenae]
MIDLLLDRAMAPFTFAMALLLGLVLLELAMALLGGSLFGLGSDAQIEAPEIAAPDLAELDLADLDLGEVELDFDGVGSELDATAGPDMPAVGGLAAWMGFGRMPFLIWLGTVLAGFGLSGFVLQSVMQAVTGGFLPGAVAAMPAAATGLWFAGRFGALFARLLPKTETQSVSERHLGRRVGVVTQGTAARGRPAEIRVTDRFGNLHYLRAEPLRDTAEIAQGTQVIVLRHRIDGGYLIVPLTD